VPFWEFGPGLDDRGALLVDGTRWGDSGVEWG